MQIWLDDGIGRAEEQLRRSGRILRPGLELKLSRDDSQKLAKPPSLCPVCVCPETLLHISYRRGVLLDLNDAADDEDLNTVL